jgi:hypothetical protein
LAADADAVAHSISGHEQWTIGSDGFIAESKGHFDNPVQARRSAGYVIEKPADSDSWSRIRQIVPSDFKPNPEPIAEGQFYYSIVDRQAAVSGGAAIPILSVASSLSTSERLELTIEDVALLHINSLKIPWEELRRFVEENPLPPGARRIWVQTVMLTRMYLSIANETEANATVSGSAYKADGKVFNRTGSMQRQSFVTMLPVDLGRFEAMLTSGVHALSDFQMLLKAWHGGDEEEDPLRELRLVEVLEGQITRGSSKLNVR